MARSHLTLQPVTAPQHKVPARRSRKPRNLRPPEGSRNLLASLGVFGMESIEPIVLGSLITGDPLLLIGPHGTGKSYLLNRVAQALGMEWRHYNASLLNYDDLVGYPLPDGNAQLRYVQTPASIWGAQIVFLDEISRCRPDMQNKLFSIIHERRVQGMLLDQLAYRWSAMNPPMADADGVSSDVAGYIGSEPLDEALADRFAFVVPIPSWEQLTPAQQQSVILCQDDPVEAEGAAGLRTVITNGRAELLKLRERLAKPLAGYIRAVRSLLAKAKIDLSPRRGTILLRNILAVHAARLAQGEKADIKGSAYLALLNSLPQRALGIVISEVSVSTAHNEAWQISAMDTSEQLAAIMLEADPVKRVALAAAVEGLSQVEFSTIISDAIAEVPLGARYAVATSLFESGAAGRLVAAVAEQCAELYGMVGDQKLKHRTLFREDNQFAESLAARVKKEPPADQARCRNLLNNLFGEERLSSKTQCNTLLSEWKAAWAALGD
jgi:MoxR-like ATPase